MRDTARSSSLAANWEHRMKVLAGVAAFACVAATAYAADNAAISAQTTPQHKTVFVTGVKQSGPYGTRVDITLDIPSGADSDAIAQDALARVGAQPLATSQFTLPTLRWPQFYHNPHAVVPQYYNPAGDTVPGGVVQALQSAEQAWTNVRTSTFTLQYAGTTTRGAAFDGVNTVSWPTPWPYSPYAIEVTIVTFQRNTGFIVDADVVINPNLQYFANSVNLTPSSYDIRYLFLHENGHVAGLPHLPQPEAVMFPFFSSGIVGHGLSDYDIDAISALYPPGSSTQLPPPHELQLSAAYTGSIASLGPFFFFSYTASGSGSHVGPSEVQGTLAAVGGAVTCPGNGFTTQHWDTITAANGDSLDVLVSDVACETPPGSNVYHSVGTYTITEGTGQFADATGQGTTDADLDLNTNAFSITFSPTPATLRVPEDLPTIQLAINSANPGDTIRVGPGRWCGARITKTLNLIGEGAAIMGCPPGNPGPVGNAFRIGFRVNTVASGTSISNFVFDGTGYSDTNQVPLALGIVTGLGTNNVVIDSNTFLGGIGAVTINNGKNIQVTRNVFDAFTILGDGSGGYAILDQGASAPGNTILNNQITATVPPGDFSFASWISEVDVPFVGILVAGQDGTVIMNNKISITANSNGDAGVGILATDEVFGFTTSNLAITNNDGRGSTYGLIITNDLGGGTANSVGATIRGNFGVNLINGLTANVTNRSIQTLLLCDPATGVCP